MRLLWARYHDMTHCLWTFSAWNILLYLLDMTNSNMHFKTHSNSSTFMPLDRVTCSLFPLRSRGPFHKPH